MLPTDTAALPDSPVVAIDATPTSTLPPDLGDLPVRLEAVLITSGRPVSIGRLAVALGLAEAEGPDAQLATPTDTPPSPTTEPKPRRRKKAGVSALSPTATIRLAVESLNAVYESTRRSFRIEQVAGGYRFMTLPAFAGPIAAFAGVAAQARLSKPAVETLAIIAYKQPVTRAQLEAIRGVACGEILRTLIDRRLVTIAGRAEELGRPILYATSKGFLEAFGLSSIKDLPTVAETVGKMG